MTVDPRRALTRLIDAFERHYEISSQADADPEALDAAEEALRDAFFTYDDELFTRFGAELPFDLLDDDLDDDLDDEEDEDGDDLDPDDDDEFVDIDD
ncbi:DNA primase [Actinomyces sp. B33]|uniref:DNA primase n=1 Tax=Actinomyces sp. B33 TaxID=2942131 RepID=UPI0023405C3D|nr:DNA primase [Actinomyces sp. B33]MDC4233361.1 DNA primase [Actinomyces sp. B33]